MKTILTFLFIFCALGSPAEQSFAAESIKPNMLLILTDDQGRF